MGSNIKLNKWKCRHCNNVFNTKMSLYEHMHIMHPEKCFKTKNKEWTCQYCNQIFHSRQKLYNHYKNCVEKAKLPKDSLGKTINIDGKRKSAETIKRKYASGELIHKSQSCSPETRAKLAEKMRKRKNIINCQCNYNEKACKFIDELNIKNNWHLQHAMNGGEYKIGPYHVDGYDKALNIVFEYDEKQSKHTQIKGILRDKCRQAYIIEKLNCEFWRYSEKDNLLYKVDKLKNLEEIKTLQEQYSNIKKSRKENSNIISEEIWIERKNLILNCDINLMEFGWLGQVIKQTGLTKSMIKSTLKHFESEFNGKYFRRKITDTP